MDRIDLYLQWAVTQPAYVNTPEEEELVTKFVSLYSMALAAKESNHLSNDENIRMWRQAYYGTLNALKQDGTESKRKSKQLRKLVYEFVESKVDNNIPKPQMTPKYKSDVPLVEVTEDFLKYNIDNIFSKYLNDRSERATYVDGTSWYKVWWDSLETNPETSGQVKVDVCLADQIVPQPGVTDWRKLEYIFELQQVSLSRIYDLYGRIITPVASDQSQLANPNGDQTDMSTITVINCYYLNEDRIVGKFSWAYHSRQVICNEHDWQIRKLRTCTKCGNVQPEGETCDLCGSKSFKYKVAEQEMLEEDLYVVYNPYEVGETDDVSQKDAQAAKVFLTAGTVIPFYKIRMLPFVPRPAVSSIESLYGVSEVFLLMNLQDSVNKYLTKMEDKTLKSGAIVTKPERRKLNDMDETFKVIDVRTPEEAQMFQTKQVAADTSQDILAANLVYESARATSGVTQSYQGQTDSTATSGKAKEIAAIQTAGRIESLRVMKAAAFAGVYELVLKYLLAFSDEPVTFVKVLPDGETTEEQWNKYMFLDKTKDGRIYYRDDFKFGTDSAATLATNRVAMWQEMTDKFIQGAFGNPQDPRTLKLYWNMMSQEQYPLAKLVLAGIKDNEQHLPYEIEQALIQNPDVLQAALATLQDGRGQSSNSGPEGNGATHAANVTRNNMRNQASTRDVVTPVQGGSSATVSSGQAEV